ncbi:MAG: glycosyltransferase family 2 protein [Chromatiaceae bacterium]|nr:glycosyltransferase family 2 protein [Chromatiaceae bacterium]MCF7993334.1 glycosyltransferase family 2 protein [Chromatiaceae bacterium]MCF8014848.1 glycosyltransferase family 2 protein [Chromatiaceae bacterium]
MPRWLRRRPQLSIIVIAYQMDRELPRTLHSLTRAYQQGTEQLDYEVLVVDNGSPSPFGAERVRAFGPEFRYHYVREAQVSPAQAVNLGVAMTRGQNVCVMIDGARMLTPGVLGLAVSAHRAYQDATISVMGWHLGPKVQHDSVLEGYNQQQEDALLASIGWPDDGYRLFEIAALAGSCARGWFYPMGESNAVFVPRAAFERLGGFEERFNARGGGFVNLDFYRRAVLRPEAGLVVLLSEGTFHQVHGGVATNAISDRAEKQQQWHDQYVAIRGERFTEPDKPPIYLGAIHPAVVPSIQSSPAPVRVDP